MATTRSRWPGAGQPRLILLDLMLPEAMSRRPNDRKVGIDPDQVEFFEAFAF